jgi:hypothetical protein
MSKFAALAAVLTLAAAVPTAAAYDLPLGVSYDLPEELLAFIAATPPDKDFAVGSGRFAPGQPADGFNISAHGSMGDVKGSVRLRSPLFGEFRGTVDCLSVVGNQAGMSGPLENPPADNPTITHFIIGVEDNGEPTAVPRDRAVLLISEAPVLPMCGVGTALADDGRVITQGNIVVKNR